MMPTLNYTTRIPAIKTLAEMQQALSEFGAAAITTRYSPTADPASIGFELVTPHGPRSYVLDVDIAAMQRLLQIQSRKGAHSRAKMSAQNFCSATHAADVAWRVAKDWLRAQLAMVEAKQVPVEEIMLPYLKVDHRTLREAYRERESALALEAGA